MKKLITVLVIIASCTVPQRLHNTGTYTVETRDGNITTFKGIKGKYLIESDTLKPDDKIVINVIRKY